MNTCADMAYDMLCPVMGVMQVVREHEPKVPPHPNQEDETPNLRQFKSDGPEGCALHSTALLYNLKASIDVS